jgi:sortase A
MSESNILFQYKEIPVSPDPLLVSAYADTNKIYKIQKVKRTFKGFMIGGLLGLIALVSPIVYAESKYRLDLLTPTVKTAQEVKIETEYPKVQSPSFQYLLNQKYIEMLKPVDPNFSIIVPKLAINSRVIPNVSAADKNEYEPALKLGAAHVKGTYLPGEGGTTFIFAHSTNYEWFIAKYNAVFYLLRNLEKDDQIQLVYQGRVYPYIVTDKKIVAANDIEYLAPKKDGEELILQTCYPPGTTEKRLLIFAHPTTETPKVSNLSYSLDKR